MANLDTALYNAYEAMGPSADAEARVLSALRAESLGSATDSARSPAEATNRTSHKRWLIALPLAACLALAAIGLSALPTRQATMQATSAMDADKANEFASLADEADEAEVDEVAGSMESDAVTEAEVSAKNLSPKLALVTLPTGEVLDVGEPYEGAVDDTNAVEATATTADAANPTICEVVDARWVRFEGDPTWYVCTPRTSP